MINSLVNAYKVLPITTFLAALNGIILSCLSSKLEKSCLLVNDRELSLSSTALNLFMFRFCPKYILP